jgi:hypothetical protein
MTPFSQRWDFWSRVAFKDGGDDGGGGGSDSGSGKFTVTNPVTGDVTRHSTKAAAEAAASSLASDLGTTVSDLAPSSSPRPTARPDRAAPSPASDDGVGMTTGTPLDTSAGIESLLPPPPPSGPRATDIYDDDDDDFVYQGPTFTGPGYTQDVTQMDVDEDTGFITEDRGVDYTPPAPAVAVDEFSSLPPSMTDQFYTPPPSGGYIPGTDPVMDAVLNVSAAPTTTGRFDPLTNLLGQQPTTQSDVVGQLVRGSIRTGQLGTRGIESLAESIAPQSQATIGYGEGQIDPGLARAAGYSGNEPIAVGDRNIISRAAGTVAEGLGRLSDRAFSNLSPAEREALTADILGEEGFNLDALRAQTLSALVPTLASISPWALARRVGPTLLAGGVLTAGETAEEALANVRNYAAENNLTPQETAALESQVLEYNAPAAFVTGALGQLPFVMPGGIGRRALIGAAEEAFQEGYAEPQVAAGVTDLTLGTDTFGRQIDPNAAVVGSLLGGGAGIALGGRDTAPAPASRAAPARPAQPAPPAPPVAPTTPGVLQIPGTDVVVNTAPVTPMIQAPTLRTPAPLGTGGTFLPGVTQQGAIITPAAPARPALPAPDAQPTVDLQTAADIIDAGLERDGGIGSETFQAVDEATGGRLNMMDVQAIMEQRMAERNAAQAFDPEAAFARLQARFPGAQTVADTVATQGLPTPRAAVDLQTAADIIDAGLARDNGIGSETFQAVDEATGGRLNMMDVQAIMEQRMAERNAAAAFDPEAAFERLQARFPGARLAEPAAATEPPAQPAFDPEAALERLRTSFPGIRTVADTTVTQEPPAALETPAADTTPTVASTTRVAPTRPATQQPIEEYVFEGEVLEPLTEVSTKVTPPREGEIIDQTISRDLTVPTQPPAAPETTVAAPPSTPTGVLVNIADEPPAGDEVVSVGIEEADEEDTGGGEGGEDTEVAVEVDTDEDGECPPGFVRRLVDGQYTCVPEEEEVLEEEEEPAFECPPGFRRVQMANGGFTCVPETARPRVGPFTQTVDVSGLAGRTVFRPGTRSR